MHQQTDRKQEKVSSSFDSLPTSSLSESLWNLPSQWINVLMRPSVATLNREKHNARWEIILVQLIILITITFVTNWLVVFIPSAAFNPLWDFTLGWLLHFVSLPLPLRGAIPVLVSFLIGLGAAYSFSKLSKGRGTFIAHAHLLLLCTIPLVTISGLILLIPANGMLAAMIGIILGILFIYHLFLHTIVIIAVHQLKKGIAIMIVLIIPMLFILIATIILTEGAILEGLIDIGPFDRKKNSKKARL